MSGRDLGGPIFLGAYLIIVLTFLQAETVWGRCIGLGLFLLLSYMGIKDLNPLKNMWIGPTYESMEKELKEIEAIQERWTYPDGSVVPEKEVKRLSKRVNILRKKMQSYRRIMPS